LPDYVIFKDLRYSAELATQRIQIVPIQHSYNINPRGHDVMRIAQSAAAPVSTE
jgi:hypothetical protein